MSSRTWLTSLTLLLAVTIAALPAAAQQAPEEVTVAPKLRAGDEFRLEIVRIREDSRQQGPARRATTQVVVKVLSADADGFRVEWTPGQATLSNQEIAAEALLKAAQQAIEGLSLRLRLTSEGTLDGLDNEAEVLAKLQAVGKVITDAVLPSIPAEQRPQLGSLLSQMLTPATLIASAMNDAGTYFGLNGLTLAVGKKAAASIEQPSILGGVIPATFEVHLQAATADTATIATTTSYAAQALIQLMNDLMARAGQSVPAEEIAKLKFSMSDSGRFQLDRRSGLMREVFVDRYVEVEGMKRRDAWEIYLVTPPVR